VVALVADGAVVALAARRVQRVDLLAQFQQ
jgi:hypothetical protein